MTWIAEPAPIDENDPDATRAYNAEMNDIFLALQNISLTQRSGAIQNHDKVGNLDARFLVFTSNGTADTQDTITHKLGRIPVGYIPVSQDKAAILYSSAVAFTSTSIYLKSSAISVAWTIIIF